jgi:glycogen phosphorylase
MPVPTSVALQPALPDLLKELALDLHWSWSHHTDKIWRQLDPVLWELTHNPFVVLQTVSTQRIREVMEDPIVSDIVQEFVEAKRQAAIAPAWYQHHYSQSPLLCIAYFSMEFMLSEALPIYSGGLGNVAGDLLKTASDLGVPLIGVGLLFQQGYSRQVIYPDGFQHYVTPFNDPSQLPLEPLRDDNGEWLRIEIKLPGYSVWLRTWKVQVGRTMLYLLDSNDAANFPIHRGITNELYGAGSEERFLQELVLGIGGWLLLESLGIYPEVCHLNEGHCAFVVVERALKFKDQHGCSFEEALMSTRAGNVFTTHTATGAGFDFFEPAMIRRYLDFYIKDRLQISFRDFLALGRSHPDDESELFNTAYLAIKGSGWVNGVSCLHQLVSQRLFSPLFPRWPIPEVPIDHLTNGVHMPTWDSPEADKLWTEACGKDRWLGTLESLEQNIRAVSSERLWAMRLEAKRQFVAFTRNRYTRQLATLGAPPDIVEKSTKLFDPGVFTIGFARRFVGYKRTNLLLHDRERLMRLLRDQAKPVQMVLAGKAHRGDQEGQRLIADWIMFIQKEGLSERIVFLSDYDMLICAQLVQGVDLWINTPQRPWEACGTSGMKVLVNGGLNLSVLDGWWDEAYDPEVGWAIGDRAVFHQRSISEEQEVQQLYYLLETEIIPCFYRQNEKGIPDGWVNRMRESMARLTPRFSANRALREYTERFYLPAATAYRGRSANKGEEGIRLARYKKQLEEKWRGVSFKEISLVLQDESYLFRATAFLSGLASNEVVAELYADEDNGCGPQVYPMVFDGFLEEQPAIAMFQAVLPATSDAAAYTARIRPSCTALLLPMECNLILWQH